jgi:hypothetical protein
MQKLSAPDVKIQSFLSERSRREHMRPKRRVERASQIVRAEAILTAGCGIFDFGIRKWHRRMAAQQEAVVARARFVNTMPTLTETEHPAQITRKARDGIGIELASDPQMFIEDGFEIASHNGFGNRLRVRLIAAGESGVEASPIQIRTQSIPTCFQELAVAFVSNAACVEAVKRTPEHDAGTGKCEFRQCGYFALRNCVEARVRRSVPLDKHFPHHFVLAGSGKTPMGTKFCPRW